MNGTDDTASGNISGEFYGGDDRCLLIVFSTYGIKKGLELSEEKTALRAELIEESRKIKREVQLSVFQPFWINLRLAVVL